MKPCLLMPTLLSRFRSSGRRWAAYGSSLLLIWLIKWAT